MTDALLSALLDPRWGFGLVARVREAPRRTASCVATINTNGADGAVQLEVTGPGNTILYTGPAYLPDRWAKETERYGWCVLYAGVFSLGAASSAAGALRALRDAAGRGELVGARVPVSWMPDE